MSIYITCDYCGKRIDTLPIGAYHRSMRDIPEGFRGLKLLGDAFVLPKDAPQFPNGVFYSTTCYNELQDCFAVWEKEQTE